VQGCESIYDGLRRQGERGGNSGDNGGFCIHFAPKLAMLALAVLCGARDGPAPREPARPCLELWPMRVHGR